MKRAPFDDVEADCDSCIHGPLGVGEICSKCDQLDADRTCPKCGVGTATYLDNQFICENRDCISDHEGAVMWKIEHGHKTILFPLPEFETPAILEQFRKELSA